MTSETPHIPSIDDIEPSDAPESTPRRRRAKAEAELPPAVVVFRTRLPEIESFPVMGINPTLDVTRTYLEWVVPADLADRFSRHHHITNGRIVRVMGA